MAYLRYLFLAAISLLLLVLGWAGFRGEKFSKPPLEIFPDMDNQAKVKYQAETPFFADQSGSRQPIAGTVPMGLEIAAAPAVEADKKPGLGFTSGTEYYRTGRFGDFYGDGLPEQIEATPALIRRGGERFNIYCAVCHGYAGNAQGITSKYGVNGIVNFLDPVHLDRSNPVSPTDGNMFNTITYGKGLMGPYGAQVSVDDRWAIIAYIRTLQAIKISMTPAAAAPAAPAATPAAPTPAPAAPAATPPAPAPAPTPTASTPAPATPSAAPTPTPAQQQ